MMESMLEQISDLDFMNMIRDAKMSNVEAANLFSVSIPTIRHWRSGQNAPYQSIRRVVRDTLRLREALDR